MKNMVVMDSLVGDIGPVLVSVAVLISIVVLVSFVVLALVVVSVLELPFKV